MTLVSVSLISDMSITMTIRSGEMDTADQCINFAKYTFADRTSSSCRGC
jgi:hypothetical protein